MINIEEEYRKELEEQFAMEVRDEIDFTVVADILKETGWTEVIISPLSSNQQAVDMLNWVEDAAKGSYFGRGTRWLFKEAKYATMFSLRWGDATRDTNS